MKSIIFLLIVLFAGILPTVYAESALSIYKDISTEKFDWSQTVIITITVSNVGKEEAKNISIQDEINPIFEIKDIKEEFAIQNNIITAKIDSIKAGESKAYSYEIKGKKGIGSQTDLQFTIPPAKITYFDGNSDVKQNSNELKIIISPWWHNNILATVTILLLVAFAGGTIGTGIHNLNTEREKIRDQENGIKRTYGYHPLLGGIAGLIVLGSFEGLSVLFADSQLQPTVQNIIVLVTTCLAAGFAPMDIINRATKQWKNEAEVQKAKANEGSNVSTNSSEELEKAKSEIESFKRVLKRIVDEGVEDGS